jgi:nicotinamidase-related amidase
MKATETAVVLIGFQNDYFGKDGILRGVIEESAETNQVLKNTLNLLNELSSTDTLLLETPILFTNDYSETKKPVGLLKAIAELKAFQVGSPGAESLPELKSYGDRIQTVPGKDGFNAFSHTGLARVFEDSGIKNVVLAGAVTSICIDSTGRSAHERGYSVTVLSDCTCGRTDFEQQFYCEQILPLYADVCSSTDLLDKLA